MPRPLASVESLLPSAARTLPVYCARLTPNKCHHRPQPNISQQTRFLRTGLLRRPTLSCKPPSVFVAAYHLPRSSISKKKFAWISHEPSSCPFEAIRSSKTFTTRQRFSTHVDRTDTSQIKNDEVPKNPSKRAKNSPYLQNVLFLSAVATGGVIIFLIRRARQKSASVSSDGGILDVQTTAEPYFAEDDAIDLDEDWDSDDEEYLLFSQTTKRPKTLAGKIRKFVTVWLVEPVLVVTRIATLFFLFAPVIVAVPAVFFGKRSQATNNERRGAMWWYRLLAAQMERAGPTFVKLAQWAASRADVFPPQLCRTLSKLHSNVQPHSFKHTRRAVEKTFNGRPIDEVFLHFDEEPIGVGAIAQVYRATFRPEIIDDFDLFPDRSPTDPIPDVVAVKVLHPRTASLIRRDLTIMSIGARLLSLLPNAEWLSFPEEVEVFGEMMLKQLDLRIEGRNLKLFDEKFKDRRNVKFPKLVKAYRKVLVEEYVDALPIACFLNAGGTCYDKSIAGIGLEGFLKMLILDNFVHADLHPGNILIRFHHANMYGAWDRFLGILRGNPLKSDLGASTPTLAAVLDRRHQHDDPEGWTRDLENLYAQGWDPQIVFIDTGLTATLDRTNRKNFLDLFRAIAEFDGRRAGTLMIERCRAPALAIRPEEFAQQIEGIVDQVKGRTFALGKVSISDVLTKVMNLVRDHHVKLEGDFVNVVLSVLLLEGIGRQLDPNLDLFKVSLPILRDLSTTEGFKKTLSEMKEIPIGGGLLLKTWLWLEARDWIKVTHEDVVAEVSVVYAVRKLNPWRQRECRWRTLTDDLLAFALDHRTAVRLHGHLNKVIHGNRRQVTHRLIKLKYRDIPSFVPVSDDMHTFFGFARTS